MTEEIAHLLRPYTLPALEAMAKLGEAKAECAARSELIDELVAEISQGRPRPF